MRGVATGWRLVLFSAGLWAFAVTLAETPTLPISGISPSDLALFCCQTSLPWLSAGVVWTWGVRIAEDHGRWILVPLLPAATVLNILTSMGVSSIEPELVTDAGRLLRDVPIQDVAPYLVWSNLFYGYLYAAGYLAARRRMRGRALLAVQRRERSDADSALREARLSSLRGQLQPDLLIDALQALQARFARSHADGDRLFDSIVAFLRAAMPGVRNHASVLGAEFETVRRYSALREMLGRTGVMLGPVETGAADIALPPLLLLPLVDRLARDAPPHDGPAITTRLFAGSYMIAIAAAAAEAPIAAALDALDAGVASAGGTVVVSRDRARTEILISLPLGIAAPARPQPTFVAR